VKDDDAPAADPFDNQRVTVDGGNSVGLADFAWRAWLRQLGESEAAPNSDD
jgi:hypothetical protein